MPLRAGGGLWGQNESAVHPENLRGSRVLGGPVGDDSRDQPPRVGANPPGRAILTLSGRCWREGDHAPRVTRLNRAIAARAHKLKAWWARAIAGGRVPRLPLRGRRPGPMSETAGPVPPENPVRGLG